MKILHLTAFILTVVGGINWGLVGLFEQNAIESLLGDKGLMSTFYILVGISAVYLGLTHKSDCKACNAK